MMVSKYFHRGSPAYFAEASPAQCARLGAQLPLREIETTVGPRTNGIALNSESKRGSEIEMVKSFRQSVCFKY